MSGVERRGPPQDRQSAASLRSTSGTLSRLCGNSLLLTRWLIGLLGVACLASGCAPADIDRTYGKRRGALGGDSVNGTAVLAGMFERAGFRVTTWRRLSPKLEDADVIVWVPDDFQPPGAEQRLFLEEWLWNKSGRTLVYVGRDYDAAISYWTHVAPAAPPEQKQEVTRRRATARSEFDAARAASPEHDSCGWFTFRREGRRRNVRSLAGAWSERIDATQLEIELGAQLAPPDAAEVETWYGREENPWQARPQYEVLLASEGDPLVFEMRIADWEDSRLLVVANGSFLLNLPLVNHEHRKLAGRLISACGPPGKAVFLESEGGGPAILATDPDATYPTGLEMFTVWPLGIIVMHLAAAGITLCVASFPIFGPPRELAVASTSDFGQHVTALGELLERTRDRQYAVDRLKYYNEHIRQDAGAGHRSEHFS